MSATPTNEQAAALGRAALREIAVKERPILFSGPMVWAILAGAKSQTRRVVKQAMPESVQSFLPCIGVSGFIPQCVSGKTAERWTLNAIDCPYGKAGERLWARETWGMLKRFGAGDYGGPPYEWEPYDGAIPKTREEAIQRGIGVDYRATSDDEWRTWKPSIHMPRWASRLTLEVVSVRVERLHAMRISDAEAEGLRIEDLPLGKPLIRGAFRELWESLHGPGSWDANCWVWAVEFRHVEGAQP